MTVRYLEYNKVISTIDISYSDRKVGKNLLLYAIVIKRGW
jgi:hypothetical protein